MTNDDELRDAPFDMLLRERLGAESAPDLSARILERHAMGDGSSAAEMLQQAEAGAQPTRRPWLAAAIVLLGIAVVAATRIVATQDSTGRQTPAVAPQDPEPSPAERRNPQDAKTCEFDLRVIDPKGGPMQFCSLDVVVHHATNQGYTTAVLRDHDLHPRDFAPDHATIRELPPGTYRAIVTAEGYVKSLSAPFELAAGQPVPRVSVRLTPGGEIRGKILASDGSPLAGVEVAAKGPPMKNLPADSPFAAIIKQRMVALFTEARVRTAADGTFAFTRLMHGDYQLQITHPDHCTQRLQNLAVADEAVRVGPIALSAGTRVSGRVIDPGGKPLSGLTVALVMPATKESWTATTDEGGCYQFGAAVPPGKYDIYASRPTGNPFDRIFQIKATTRHIVITADQPEFEVELTMRKG